MAVIVEPWPNKLGHTVLLGDHEIAQVFDAPELEGVKVVTYDGKGEADLVLEYQDKVPPLKAVALCYVLGKPADPDRPDDSDFAELRARHGEGAVILVHDDCAAHCLPEDKGKLEAAGVPTLFPRADLDVHAHRLVCEGLKVVVVHAAQLARALGGGQ